MAFFKQALEENSSPEALLWRAVLETMVKDALSTNSHGTCRLNKANAISWLNIKNKDFRMVCDYAGLHPDYIWKKVSLALENGRRLCKTL